MWPSAARRSIASRARASSKPRTARRGSTRRDTRRRTGHGASSRARRRSRHTANGSGEGRRRGALKARSSLRHAADFTAGPNGVGRIEHGLSRGRLSRRPDVSRVTPASPPARPGVRHTRRTCPAFARLPRTCRHRRHERRAASIRGPATASPVRTSTFDRSPACRARRLTRRRRSCRGSGTKQRPPAASEAGRQRPS